MIPLYILPGYDAVRFQWSYIPFFIKIIGFIGVALSLILMFLVTKENSFLARTVKIQEDKGHQVITTGPYRFVRHPLYTGMIIYIICHSLALGSLYSLIPGFIINIGFIFRTKFEDKLLHEKLEGYMEYAQKTRYKLIPRIW